MSSSDPELQDLLAKHGHQPASLATLNGTISALQEGLQAAFQKHKDARQQLELRVAALEREIAELKARPVLKDAGIWTQGAAYTVGDVVQSSGSSWVCHKAHEAGPAIEHNCFRLWVKKGRDGRDR